MSENIPYTNLDDLFAIVEDRKGASPEESYTARLHAKGLNKIAQKVGEEGVETVIAALAEDKEHLIMESADLLYHLSVLWSACDVKPEDVYRELGKRHGQKKEN